MKREKPFAENHQRKENVIPDQDGMICGGGVPGNHLANLAFRAAQNQAATERAL